MADQCPVTIHKVTEGGNSESVGQCPVTGQQKATSNPTIPEGELDFAEFEENPSYQEYKKIKRVMAMITKFYQTGSEGKRANYDSMTEELKKLEADLGMVQSQIDALNTKPYFTSHPKRKDYFRDLSEEKENLLKQKQGFEEKQKEFFELSEWSKGIVQVCEWLETSLDHYCLEKLPELPDKIKETMKPIEPITQEQAKLFAKGLDEVVYNLRESQDFFAASLDGRLNKYHNIEKEIIEEQLKAIRTFPEDNPRRLFVEAELEKDLEYVNSNMQENPEVIGRREKMLKSHHEFYHVLMYNKDRLAAMGVTFEERKYNTKYDHYNDQ